MMQVLGQVFKNAVLNFDYETLESSVIDFQNVMIAQSSKICHEEFHKLLLLSEQKAARAERTLGERSEREKCIYLLGCVYGTMQVFRALLEREIKEAAIIAVNAAQSEKTDDILYVLYTENNGQGMRHGELAKALDMSESSLTNIMKRVLQSGAVESSRAGKNTFYILSKAGRDYCFNKKKHDFVPSKKQLTDEVQKAVKTAIDDLYNANKTKMYSYEIGLGDVFNPVINGELKGKFILKKIIKSGKNKLAECEQIPSASRYHPKPNMYKINQNVTLKDLNSVIA